MNSRTRITVVIPAFNSAPTIARALDSALAQTYFPDEILVVDDCSSDATADIVREYESKGVRLISLEHQRGAGGARNVGIQAATGELIAFLDSDDEWLKSKLMAQTALLEACPRLSFVACAANLISPTGEDLGDLYRHHPVVTGAECWRALLAFNFVATPAVTAWRRHLVAVNGFDENLKIGEDQDLWIKLALAGEFGYVHQSLVRVHVRENSLSAWCLQDLLTYTLPMIERHVAALRGRLSKSEIRRIMGERLGRLGRVAYAKGAIRTGFWFICRSIFLGYRPVEGLYYLVATSPPAIWLRRRSGIGTAP